MDVAGADNPDFDDSPQLTPRQVEILRLLKAGKANKEIAYELGIGLGTVKQHMVALFKKLNVTNRAMAVSRGFAMERQQQSGRESRSGEAGGLEWRPATVLSVVGAPDGDDDQIHQGWRLFQRTLAAIACDFDATVVARPGAGGDLILGVQRVHEDDAVRALEAAAQVERELTTAFHVAGLPPLVLGAGAASGFLIASMHRFGGWTGEMVAGRVIGLARSLAAAAGPDRLLLAPSLRRLTAFSLRTATPAPEGDHDPDTPLSLPLADAVTGLTAPPLPPPRLFGRGTALDLFHGRLAALRDGRGGVVVVEGESGMGKTALAQALRELCRDTEIAWIETRCRASHAGDTPLIRLHQAFLGPGRPDPANLVRHLTEAGPLVAMIDDLHWADAATLDFAEKLAAATARAPLLLAAFRRPVGPAALDGAEKLRLGRLSSADLTALIAELAPGNRLPPEERQSILELAAGVPLFAVELVRETLTHGPEQGQPALPLSLMVLVLARLDALRLDRVLLRLAAADARLATAWPGDPAELDRETERALRAGVLTRDARGQLGFSHPLLRQVIRQVTAATENVPVDRLVQPVTV